MKKLTVEVIEDVLEFKGEFSGLVALCRYLPLQDSLGANAFSNGLNALKNLASQVVSWEDMNMADKLILRVPSRSYDRRRLPSSLQRHGNQDLALLLKNKKARNYLSTVSVFVNVVVVFFGFLMPPFSSYPALVQD